MAPRKANRQAGTSTGAGGAERAAWRIRQLTDEQVRALTAVRDTWVERGLATGPADRVEAERGVAEAYRAAGLRRPWMVIWLGSPLAGTMGAWALATLWDRAGSPVKWPIWDELKDQAGDWIRSRVGGEAGRLVSDHVRKRPIWDQVGLHVREQIQEQIRKQLYVRAIDESRTEQVWRQVREQLRDQLKEIQVWGRPPSWDQPWGRLWGQSWDEDRDGRVDRVGLPLFGQHGAEAMAVYDFYRTYCSTAKLDRFAGVMRVAAAAGWWWPYENAVILTERPTALHRDGQGRLHREDGPVVEYPDGFAVHAWHGVRVPASFVETVWDAGRILREPNAEVRRCAIERLGWDRFVQDAGLTEVASCPDPGNPPHHLTLYDLPHEWADLYPASARILLCVNGTPDCDGIPRRYGLPVPAHHTDPIAAAADLYGWPVQAYRNLEVRR